MRTLGLAALLIPGLAMAQPVLEERLVLTPVRLFERPAFQSSPPPSGFQTRITRSSIRDHLRDYRVRPLQDGVVVQRRFTIGK
jgi:hypothetical protein